MSSLLLLTPVAAAALGMGVETVRRGLDRRRFPLPDRRQDVGGHALHYRLRGAGDAVVVLEAGDGDWSAHWGKLPEQLGAHATVIAYDRAGPGPRTVDTIARELHQLLGKLVPHRRVVLVAHSFGGHVARMYAHRYPFEIAGMVLVDAYHEGLAERLRHQSIPSPDVSPLLLRALALGNRLGLLRLLRLHPSVPGVPHLPYSALQRAALVARGFEPSVLRTMREELEARPASEAQLRALADHFDFPVRVLTATETMRADGAPKGYPVEEFNRLWVEQNAALLALSSDARQVLADGSHHHLHLHSPHLVIDAVREVLDAARAVEPA
jgi:pimeloyl-ACP methyl ester carboxylesterase